MNKKSVLLIDDLYYRDGLYFYLQKLNFECVTGLSYYNIISNNQDYTNELYFVSSTYFIIMSDGFKQIIDRIGYMVVILDTPIDFDILCYKSVFFISKNSSLKTIDKLVNNYIGVGIDKGLRKNRIRNIYFSVDLLRIVNTFIKNMSVSNAALLLELSEKTIYTKKRLIMSELGLIRKNPFQFYQIVTILSKL
ncbi:TPA: hypothetical protein MJA52_003920 [Klebsiella aerogenes]|nr:hypothetical protein [Klebsiella aerogenes]